MLREGRALALFAACLSFACQVDVDPGKAGFPCNPDGSCREGLVCVEDICDMLDVDGGSTDCTLDPPAPLCLDPTGDIVLTADPDTIPSDATGQSTISSDTIRDRTGGVIADDSLVRLSTDLGTFATPAGTPLTEIDLLSLRGVVTTVLYAEGTAGTATVQAQSVNGDAVGSVQVTLSP